MHIRQTTFAQLASALVLCLTHGSHAATNDRLYLMGDGDAGPPTNGAAVVTTFDSAGLPSMSQFVDLNASGGPVYRTVTGRPDGVGGLGVEFNGNNYLQNFRLGLPETSFSAIGAGGTGTLDYTGINNRGLQFWVKPAATAAQTLVMDTNQHGARINAAGNFSMRYADVDYDSSVAATVGAWRHVMVVRPSGDGGGSRMYVDGVAVAAAAGGYDGGDTSRLVVGANTAGDEENFSGGTLERFSGVIDDLKLFVIGSNDTADYGGFDVAIDNDFVKFKLSGFAGDVDNDGDLDQNDKNAFISGWMTENLIDDFRIGDLVSYGKGDLNFDGVTDINDLVVMQNALTSANIAAITGAELAGIAVPEPAALLLLSVVMFRRCERIRRREFTA